MAELADALDSGSNDRKVVEVQVLLSAPRWCDKKDVTPFFLVFMRVCGLFGGKTGERFHRRCPKGSAPPKAVQQGFLLVFFRMGTLLFLFSGILLNSCL